jgi:V/A-type H+/Na+-transporting ATPase subunit D
MSENIKLNKVSLREQKQKLGMYQRFLPALEARKQLFLLQLSQIRKDIQETTERLNEALRAADAFSPLYWDMEDLLAPFLEIESIVRSIKNFAGLKVPHLDTVVFREPAYGMFDTPYSFEQVRDHTRRIIILKTRLQVLGQQENLISESLRKTSQRINLYEQRLIPGCRDAIRRINVYLQDQRAVAVGVAKAAKRLNALSF